MKFMKYKYTGPLSSVALEVEGKTLDVLLNPKRLVEMPSDHEYTKTLVAQGRLVLIPDAPIEAPRVDKTIATKGKTNGS